MKQTKYASHSPSALEQLQKNSCSWIGQMTVGSAEHAAGQTFQCPDNGEVENIQVYTTAVPHPGKVILTLHSFDPENKKWGPVLTQTEIDVDKNYVGNWMEFHLPGIQLQKDNSYGFRLRSSDALVGVGEAAWTSNGNFKYGEEWHADNLHSRDQYFRYFSLAFKVELRA